MQIQLKQAEIVAALKQYITQQGIQLKDKEVTITFTAGRKEGGLSADLVIEDAGIPGFTDSTNTDEGDEKKAPGLTVVDNPPPPDRKAVAESPKTVIEEPDTAAEAAPAGDPPVVKTNSLFS